jgi:hypothetical protein
MTETAPEEYNAMGPLSTAGSPRNRVKMRQVKCVSRPREHSKRSGRRDAFVGRHIVQPFGLRGNKVEDAHSPAAKAFENFAVRNRLADHGILPT